VGGRIGRRLATRRRSLRQLALTLAAVSLAAAGPAAVIGRLVADATHELRMPMADDGLLVRPAATDAWTTTIDGLLDQPDRARRPGEHATHDSRRLSAAAHVRTLDRIVTQAPQRHRSA